MSGRPRAVLSVSLSAVRSASLPTSIGRLLGDFAASFLRDSDAVWRLQMVAHELAENLVKYASGDAIALEVSVEDLPDGGTLCTVISRNSAEPARLDEARRGLSALLQADEPRAYYARLMAENAFRAGSGLGLARIRAEGGFDIDFSIDGSTLTVRASSRWRKSEHV